MASLTAHLLDLDRHAAMGFRPDCPVCRAERLSGRLTQRSVVSTRIQAGVLAGVISLSASTLPAVAVAKPPPGGMSGSESEGDSTDAGTGDDTAANPDDPDSSAPSLDPPAGGDPASGPSGADAAAVPAPPPATPQPDGTVDDSVPPPALPSGPPPPQEESGAQTPDPGPSTPSKRKHRGDRGGKAGGGDPHRGGGGQPETAPSSVPTLPSTTQREVAQATSPTPSAGSSSGDRSDRARSEGHSSRTEDGVHVVRRGESLWTIAADRLGRVAGNAAIAREVNRLWSLNADRIASGKPDLIMPGDRLRTS